MCDEEKIETNSVAAIVTDHLPYGPYPGLGNALNKTFSHPSWDEQTVHVKSGKQTDRTCSCSKIHERHILVYCEAILSLAPTPFRIANCTIEISRQACYCHVSSPTPHRLLYRDLRLLQYGQRWRSLMRLSSCKAQLTDCCWPCRPCCTDGDHGWSPLWTRAVPWNSLEVHGKPFHPSDLLCRAVQASAERSNTANSMYSSCDKNSSIVTHRQVGPPLRNPRIQGLPRNPNSTLCLLA